MEQLTSAELAAKGRKRLPKGDFAHVDEEGMGHLPIHDAEHVRNALARLNQTDIPDAEKRKALRKILRAAKKFGVDVDKDSDVVKRYGAVELSYEDRKEFLREELVDFLGVPKDRQYQVSLIETYDDKLICEYDGKKWAVSYQIDGGAVFGDPIEVAVTYMPVRDAAMAEKSIPSFEEICSEFERSDARYYDTPPGFDSGMGAGWGPGFWAGYQIADKAGRALMSRMADAYRVVDGLMRQFVMRMRGIVPHGEREREVGSIDAFSISMAGGVPSFSIESGDKRAAFEARVDNGRVVGWARSHTAADATFATAVQRGAESLLESRRAEMESKAIEAHKAREKAVADRMKELESIAPFADEAKRAEADEKVREADSAAFDRMKADRAVAALEVARREKVEAAAARPLVPALRGRPAGSNDGNDPFDVTVRKN